MLGRLPSSQRWTSAAIVVVTLGIVAVFLAMGVNCLVLVQLLRLVRPMGEASERQPPRAGITLALSERAPGQELPDPGAILTRNVFDYRTGSLPKPAPHPSPAPAAPQPDPSAPCELPLRLTAVVFDATQPARSLAMLRGPESGSSRVSSSGMRFGQHTLAEVLPRSARFERDGQSCWLRMFSLNARDKIAVERANSRAQLQASKKRGRKGPRRPEIQPYPPNRALSPAELARGIQKKQTDSYLLDPKTLQKALERWDHVAATTRVSAIRRRGARGLRIVTLRDAGLLANLGLRSGDVLRAANGRSISRERDLRRTIARLASGTAIALAVERDGHRLTLDYAPSPRASSVSH